jgi:hypothetical protein
MKTSSSVLLSSLIAITACSRLAAAEWQTHTVRQRNGAAAEIPIPAKLQIVTEPWNRVVAVPYLVYMPEKDRLLMLIGCDYPHQAMVLSSDDRGATWTEPKYLHVDGQGKSDAGLCTGLTYLGGGKVTATMGDTRWLSQDFGNAWSSAPIHGMPLNGWDPQLVERDAATGKVARIVEAGYTGGTGSGQQGYIRFSADEGATWSEARKVPQWQGVSEVAFVYARNGDLIGACRTDISAKTMAKFGKELIDHYEGLGISISKDRGNTWSDVTTLYDWGRHHPSLLLMPNGDVVMTYVVRKGYVDTAGGFPQFGIEALVSRDNGQTWDLDHRYLLHTWAGKRKGETAWWPSSQATSSVLLPDGAILPAFGTGYRSETGAECRPRDVGLVLWRPGEALLNADRTLRDAPFDSDLRNVADPAK